MFNVGSGTSFNVLLAVANICKREHRVVGRTLTGLSTFRVSGFVRLRHQCRAAVQHLTFIIGPRIARLGDVQVLETASQGGQAAQRVDLLLPST